ncbi:hypothetical protein COU78_06360 [Candidatus Peregrinibacteria bacterium CG10_big_fil_rev_8_21_14_0_10_49_24]|nr:MAG: hypothetical protein COV83_03190 [Candidatus Peregrinibacteria bacterium CG11_big_fil_rev_8_21_14_0_20_49_14]PIR50473.1 MAG: hypothetical protein COU78_06360 [Candidatus Peregrinibacteria bacterium CG10_big_fil_rev_8_21_14_0_10_49_24]PJA68309.1 MAG: hypothetical protein CO157_00350 [Candidatus Peregrinibacteria bacterium CG_4_9_14_3_um_filter_49_12]
MKTILLLAGRSTRFWPLAEKTLFPVCGKTLLEHQISRLRSGGCDDLVLVGGEHNLQDAQLLYPDIPCVQQEDLQLGMRGALLSALPKLGTESVMIVSGNDVIHPDGYRALIKAASKKGVGGALLAQKTQRYFPGGYLTLDNGRITSIVEKPGEGKEPSDLVNIVAHIHNDPRALLDALHNIDKSKDDGYEQALQKLFDSHTYHAVAYEGEWQAVKYPWHLLSLLELLLEDCTKLFVHDTATVHPTAVIDGPVVLGEGVKVMPHATVRGPCTVGPNTVIANNALVRNSSIGSDCVIGYNTEVKGSVLHSHVWTHMTYIGDSVIGRNVSFGGGAVTANFRLDEQEVTSMVQGEQVQSGCTKLGAIIGNDCRLGIQVGISPGIKIGSGSFVSSGTMVTQDIPENQFVRMKDGKLHHLENRTAAPNPDEREKYKQDVTGGKQ